MGRFTKMDFSNEVKEVSNPNLTKLQVRGRYDTKTKLRLEDNTITIRNLKQSDLVARKSDRDLVHKVTLDEDERPDLIALKYYGDARLYWVLLGANGFREKSEVRKDMLIRIPAKSTLFGAGGVLIR